MAEIEYSSLEKDYSNFSYPRGSITVNGKSTLGSPVSLMEIEVELTSGYEASIATYFLAGIYDEMNRKYDMELVQPFITLGSLVKIGFGYNGEEFPVFMGYIAKVNFRLDTDNIPGVEVTCMDVKGMMMTGRHSKQLAAKFYADAVRERVNDGRYAKFLKESIIDNTPDMPPETAQAGPAEETDVTMEMVDESDYEYITKIAKRYNYDFYIVAGTLIFRKAKSDSSVIMQISTETGLKSINVEYDISGIAGKIEVRSTDPNTGKLIVGKSENKNTLSLDSKATPIVSKAKLVYIDPTVQTQKDADARAEFLLEDISFRLGTAYITLIGIPSLVPGRFIELLGFGKGIDNTFYIQTVRHIYDDERGYITELVAKTAAMDYKPKVSVPF